MHFQRYYLNCLAHASYLIADEKTKIAAVVDPQRDVEQYLADAATYGYRIKYVFLTHFHADFVAGHIELRDKVGAKIYLGARAQAEYDFTPVKEGDVIEFGDVRLEILETPGHTPEGISILVYDLPQDDRTPYAVLTGDTLFIGDVGRPDLLASIGVTADELANMLYDSIAKLRALPDSVRVYPAHGAGSLCGKSLSTDPYSTIGEQKKYNYAMQPMSRSDFIQMVQVDQPDAPSYFAYDAIKNRQERPSLEMALKSNVKPIELDEVLRLQKAEAVVLDVRDAIDFEAAHLRGSIHIGLKGKYATWCGTLLTHDRPVIIITNRGDEVEAVMRLGRIGFDNVVGYLRDGMEGLHHRDDLIESTPRITAKALHAALESESPPVVLDVRTAKERESVGFLKSSLHIPLQQLEARLNEVPRNRELVVHCEGGYRSAIACSLLQRHGLQPADLVGGFKAWVASDLTIAQPVGSA